MRCPEGHEVVYAAFSGGREMYCPDCGDNWSIDACTGEPPRAVLLQTEEGREELRRQMQEELDKRSKES